MSWIAGSAGGEPAGRHARPAAAGKRRPFRRSRIRLEIPVPADAAAAGEAREESRHLVAKPIRSFAAAALPPDTGRATAPTAAADRRGTRTYGVRPSWRACSAASQKAEISTRRSPSHLLVWANSTSRGLPVGGT